MTDAEQVVELEGRLREAEANLEEIRAKAEEWEAKLPTLEKMLRADMAVADADVFLAQAKDPRLWAELETGEAAVVQARLLRAALRELHERLAAAGEIVRDL